MRPKTGGIMAAPDPRDVKQPYETVRMAALLAAAICCSKSKVGELLERAKLFERYIRGERIP